MHARTHAHTHTHTHTHTNAHTHTITYIVLQPVEEKVTELERQASLCLTSQAQPTNNRSLLSVLLAYCHIRAGGFVDLLHEQVPLSQAAKHACPDRLK